MELDATNRVLEELRTQSQQIQALCAQIAAFEKSVDAMQISKAKDRCTTVVVALVFGTLIIAKVVFG